MKVLIVEDCKHMQELMREELEEGGVTVVSAFTFGEARQLFGEHSKDLGIIAMDGCLESMGRIDTELLVGEIRPKFSGIMIAISGSLKFREMLVKAGCDEACEKLDLAGRILAIKKKREAFEDFICPII